MRTLDDITSAIIGCSLKIHIRFGPGLFESVYEALLARQLELRGFRVARQMSVPLVLDGLVFEEGFRVDLLVDGQVPVEIKSLERLNRVHSKQLLTYLRLMDLPVGMLINFGGETLKDGLHRIVNHLTESDSPALRVNHTHSTVAVG